MPSQATELEALSEKNRLPVIALAGYAAEAAAIALLPQDVARRLNMLPLFRIEERLFVALSDPSDLSSQDYVQQLTGCTLELVLALRSDIEGALNRIYLSAEHSGRAMGDISGGAGAGVAAPLEEKSDLFEDREAPAIKTVEHIVAQAIRLGASDIHLEPYARRVELRYRVDGILHVFPPPPVNLYPAVVSRIKIASRLDIAERRLPQDGRATMRVDDCDYDLRVAIIPNLHGEGVVIRILSSAALTRSLDDLGFDPPMRKRWEALIGRPHGVVLVTGPTGSGKTTTLYASLQQIFTVERKFVTLEDPVELQMDGVTQIQVRPEIGFNFADGLRAVLRYDPDVIMLGEIRDVDSAEIAIRASLTGHLLLSTLHTNDAPLAVTRLVDMGVAPYKVLTSLNGVLAQRLLRRLCPSCKAEACPAPALREMLALEEGIVLYEPRGCSDCGGLGYRGRVAVYELLEITQQMRRLEPGAVSPESLRELAPDFLSLRDSAVQKLRQGITSMSEVLGVTAEY